MSVGFFTKGVIFELPHPPISERTILIICNVIDKAWTLLAKDPPEGFDFCTANENTITTKLKEIIENRLRKSEEVPGFNKKIFGRVSRDSKITNYNGMHPDKMPDLFFDLKRENLPVYNDQDGLFVECKPIDNTHPVLSCYLKAGLNRFVNGDYAWAMQDALMVGYAHPSYNQKKLATEFNSSKTFFLNIIAHSQIEANRLCESKHSRYFDWLDNRGKACPIKIYHLWKECPCANSN
jgi:hypothetical protein